MPRHDSAAGAMRGLPRSIWALFAVRLIISAGNFVFPFLTLILTTRLAWPADRVGAFLTIMQAAALPGVFLGGKLSDSLDRRKIIVICQAIAALLFFACLIVGFHPILPYLIALGSVSLAMTWPISGALVADLVPPERRKSAYSLLYWGNNIGFSIGPLAAGFLLHRAPSLMFLGNAVALCVSIAILMNFVPETAVVKPAGTSGSEEAPYTGSMWSVLLKRPQLIIFSLIVAVMNFVYSQNTFSLPLYLNTVMGASGSEVFGSAMTTNGITVVLCTLFISKFTGRFPVLINMTLAAGLYAVGFGVLAFPASLPLVLFSTVLWTWGEILAATNINVYIVSKTPITHRGRISSFTSLISNLGSLSGPALAGLIIQNENPGSIWPIALIVGISASALMLILAGFDRSLGPRAESVAK
jgi:MFS family permease